MPYAIAITTISSQEEDLKAKGYQKREVWMKLVLSKENGEKELFSLKPHPPFQFCRSDKLLGCRTRLTLSPITEPYRT
jgi:hypothetical protein